MNPEKPRYQAAVSVSTSFFWVSSKQMAPRDCFLEALCFPGFLCSLRYYDQLRALARSHFLYHGILIQRIDIGKIYGALKSILVIEGILPDPIDALKAARLPRLKNKSWAESDVFLMKNLTWRGV